MAAQFDAVRAIEACYASATDDAGWLRNLKDAMQPLTRGLAPGVFTFAIAEGRLRFGMSEGVPAALVSVMRAIWDGLDPEDVKVWFSVPPAGMASKRLARTSPQGLERLRPIFAGAGICDAVAAFAVEPDGRGVIMSVPYSEPVRLSPQTLHQLGRVTAHLGTALRLRSRGMSSIATDEGDLEAVFDPGGRVQHATGAAREAASREALSMAVRGVEGARGRLRRTSPDEAIAAWQGLVNGRWSLVDRVESDGRRYVLARRNEPGVQDIKALLPRERDVLAFAALGHSNKHIGYTLGIAPNTVATHLASSMVKLGLRSRRELIAMFGPMARVADTRRGAASRATL